jgi:hypothetical protein
VMLAWVAWVAWVCEVFPPLVLRFRLVWFCLGLTPPVSGGPQPTDSRTGKKPALWAVRSTGMLGAARGQRLAVARPPPPYALRPARSLRSGGPPPAQGWTGSHAEAVPCTTAGAWRAGTGLSDVGMILLSARVFVGLSVLSWVFVLSFAVLVWVVVLGFVLCCLWHLTPPVSGGPQPTDPQTGTKRALWAVRSTGMLGAAPGQDSGPLSTGLGVNWRPRYSVRRPATGAWRAGADVVACVDRWFFFLDCSSGFSVLGYLLGVLSCPWGLCVLGLLSARCGVGVGSCAPTLLFGPCGARLLVLGFVLGVCPLVPLAPNARFQPPLEAGAERTL